MAQGAAKKPTGPSLSKKSKKPSGLLPKRGSRVIAPKKPKLIAKRKLMKKHTSGLTALTEKNLAERAGHLELLGGGKKDKKEQQKKEAQKAKK